MANLNDVKLIGRLTRDPECRSISNGGKVANFALAVSEYKKRDGGSVEEPHFFECVVFNGESRKLADFSESYLKKGMQIYIGGKLRQDRWETKDGEKRSMVKVYVTDIQLLERKEQEAPKKQREEIPPEPEGEIPF